VSRIDLEAELAALEAMPLDELRTAWVRRLKSRPPKVSAGLLRLALAHSIQSKAYGCTAKSIDRRLRNAEGRVDRSAPRPGTRLVRAWRGTAHVVTVTEAGHFHWQDRDWGSLSEIARKITGTRWSGPAFFGLKQRSRVVR